MILTAAEMRAAEQALFDKGTDPYALMERAGAAAAEIIWRAGGHRELLVLCGPGNNGGDGYVVARLLRERGVPVRVAATGESTAASASRARAAWIAEGGAIEELAVAEPANQVVDALFGIGLSRPLEPAMAAHLTRLMQASSRTYAIDLPSGVDTDSGVLLSAAPNVDICITFGAWKPAHWLQPAAGLMQQRLVCDIGIDTSGASAHVLAKPVLAPPAADDHKYRRGLVAVVAGDMTGAAALAAEAAAHAGAGYVRLLADNPIAQLSHAIVRVAGLDFDRAKAVLAGPGLGRDARATECLSAALRSGVPVVADADALRIMAENAGAKAAICTPHEGEFDHMFGEGDGGKLARTRAAAAKADMVLVHKGPDTVIAAPDGRAVIAPPASSWLSTAGTGDVLAGIIAARLAVTGDPFRAACEGVWLHGEAARRAGAAFVADDLIDHLGDAMTS